jgi:hypothetical protein
MTYNVIINIFVLNNVCDKTRNIWRAYSITAGQDLFGDWIVTINYDRIGARWRTKIILLPDEA